MYVFYLCGGALTASDVPHKEDGLLVMCTLFTRSQGTENISSKNGNVFGPRVKTLCQKGQRNTKHIRLKFFVNVVSAL